MSRISTSPRVSRNIVLDASAVLANVLREPGGERVDDLFDSLEAGETLKVAIGSVNWCEILTRLFRDNRNMATEELAALLAGVELVAFDRDVAEVAAGFARIDASLSLGDRACLALASSRQAAAWTTDKQWSRLNLGVKVEILR